MRTGEQNAPLIDEILSLKQKQAKLLGFESYADVSLASKMAASVAEIEELHELLAAKATPALTAATPQSGLPPGAKPTGGLPPHVVSRAGRVSLLPLSCRSPCGSVTAGVLSGAGVVALAGWAPALRVEHV